MPDPTSRPGRRIRRLAAATALGRRMAGTERAAVLLAEADAPRHLATYYQLGAAVRRARLKTLHGDSR